MTKELESAQAEVRRLNAYVERQREDNEKAWTECTKFRRLFHEARAEIERLKSTPCVHDLARDYLNSSCDEDSEATQ